MKILRYNTIHKNGGNSMRRIHLNLREQTSTEDQNFRKGWVWWRTPVILEAEAGGLQGLE